LPRRDFCRAVARVRRADLGKGTMTRCPICKSEAAEIDRGLFDGDGFDCRFHGRFRDSGTVLAQGKRRTRRQWEHALTLAKVRVTDDSPLISSELLWLPGVQRCLVSD
jgi:hypothetical protein